MRWICSFYQGLEKERFVTGLKHGLTSTDHWDALPFKRKVDAKIYVKHNFPTAKNVLIEKVCIARA